MMKTVLLASSLANSAIASQELWGYVINGVCSIIIAVIVERIKSNRNER